MRGRISTRLVVVAGVLVALLLAGGASFYASGDPDGLTKVTGYQFEPWHFRYVGESLATAMHDTKIKTLEQFFDLPSAPDYK